jgi:hypothetical protein
VEKEARVGIKALFREIRKIAVTKRAAKPVKTSGGKLFQVTDLEMALGYSPVSHKLGCKKTWRRVQWIKEEGGSRSVTEKS